MTFVRKTSYVKRVRKHRYIKPVALLLAAVLLCGTAGCRKDEERISDPESPAVVSDSAISNGSFDWDKALSEFYIDGIKMEYPFSESSLGEDFKFKDESFHYNDSGNYLTVVVDHKDCSGLWLFEAQYNGVTEDTYKPNCIPDAIYSIFEPSVQGIQEGTSMEVVYDLWGEPDEIEGKINSSDHDKAIYYGKKDGQKLYLWYDNTTNKVESIQIDFVDMKG